MAPRAIHAALKIAILSWGVHAKALAPTELVKAIIQTLRETVGRYSAPNCRIRRFYAKH
jgi:predicted DNA-binding transcriptional regulator YafY